MTGSDASTRALRITEVVRMICEAADALADWYLTSKERGKLLVALARVSKIFLEPALDCIWRQVINFNPLLKCLPRTLWEERVQNGLKTISLRRPVVATDLPGLLFHSQRVKSLSNRFYQGNRYAVEDPEVFQMLHIALGGQCLVPKIDLLNWQIESKEETPFLHHLLAPSLRTLILRLDPSKASLSVLSYVQTACPLLTRFDLTVKPSVPDARATYAYSLFSRVVCGWKQLQELTIPGLDASGFTHISQLPSLIDLDLTAVVGAAATVHLPSFISGFSTFPALKYLRIVSESHRLCAGLVETISSSEFESLTLELPKNWTTVGWKEVFTSLRSCLDQGRLGKLDTIEVTVKESTERVRPENAPQYTLSADTIRPLLGFKSLTSFSLQMYPGLFVDDDFLAELAVAWPKISSLQLGTDVLITEQPTATLACLIPFARHCPELSYLGIRIRTSEVPEFTQVPGERIELNLENLYVGTSPIKDDMETMGSVAAFLSDLCHDLEELRTPDHDIIRSNEELVKYAGTWHDVSELMAMFSSVRSKEKEFWTGQKEDSEDEE